jgi:hypothetical protein
MQGRPPKVIKRPTISRAAAAYVVRHVENACRLFTEATSQGTPLEPFAASSASVRESLHQRILVPIFNSHPNLATSNSSIASISKKTTRKKVYRATKKDIGKSTAIWLYREIQQQIPAANSKFESPADQSTEEEQEYELIKQKHEPIFNAISELLAVTKIVNDAYPDFCAKEAIAISGKRTAESDASFRKYAVPKGSVRLTGRAISKIKYYMKQFRSHNQRNSVASIMWTIDSMSKGPEDEDWTSTGAGLGLGFYFRSQVPPDILEKVDGIEIFFHADTPSRLSGKTIDFRKSEFVILEQ